MTSSARSVNVDSVHQLAEAVRTGGGLTIGKFLRVASAIGGYTPETDPRYPPDGRTGETDDIERFQWVSRWLGLKEPGVLVSPVRERLQEPRVIPARGHAERTTHQLHTVRVSIRLDELVLRTDSPRDLFRGYRHPS